MKSDYVTYGLEMGSGNAPELFFSSWGTEADHVVMA